MNRVNKPSLHNGKALLQLAGHAREHLLVSYFPGLNLRDRVWTAEKPSVQVEGEVGLHSFCFGFGHEGETLKEVKCHLLGKRF